MLIRVIGFLLFVAAGSPSWCQTTFRADVDGTDIRVGGFFTISFELQGQQGGQFTPPKFDNFKVAGGPSRSFQTSIFNGKASRTETYSYQLKALEKGTFTIAPATVVVQGKQVRSNSITVKVLDAMKREDVLRQGAPDEEPYFITASLSRDTAFVGERLVLDYRIFTKTKINNVDLHSESDFTMFEQQAVPLRNTPTDQVEINGDTYITKLVARYNLYPKRVGKATLDPARFIIMLPSKRRRGFFFDQYAPKYVTTNATEVVIRPLPINAPEDFSGAIGHYAMEMLPSNQHLSTDDAITIRMKITGDGDPNRIAAKPLPASLSLEPYEPKVLSARNARNGARHEVEMEYIFTANAPGSYFVEPTFTYFDVDSQQFITLATDTIDFNVRAGSGTRTQVGIDTSVVYIRTDEAVMPQRMRLWGDTLPIRLAWLGLVLASLGFAIWKWRLAARRNMPVVRSLAEQARYELDELAQSSESQKAHRVEEILTNYLRASLDIDASDWTIASFQQQAKTEAWSTSRIESIIDILNRCQFAAYAGMNETQTKDMINTAKAVIMDD